ncbi:IclR family transcriptional regulator [Pseudomonas lalucatii]|uniref:HTH-type transcriptional repressor AllR n=1 Tax=Pseudomonas lalucatii TaxID=1424203 RepID=A0ABS5PZR0_9PSED|nr:IclR family transcriptional regulator [Pseudomonas lalucatii]MBS7726175.1 IclR family transcriptional regulator [Pseudomonas lalucatii]
MTTTTREKGSSIGRVLEIIEAVSKAERPMSPADLAYQLDIPKPSIHRLLGQLEGDGYLQINMRGLLVPGDRMHDIALGVLYSGRFKAPRQAILKRLVAQIGETCGIAIPNGTEMIYYDRAQAERPLQLQLSVGSHTPIWCTASGKLYLSSLPRERRRRILNNLPLQRLARNTLTSAAELEAALQRIREEELGIDNEEFVDGLVACAVPIRGRDGRLFACLFSHAPLIGKSLEELLAYTPLLREAAGELGQLITDTEVVRDR